MPGNELLQAMYASKRIAEQIIQHIPMLHPYRGLREKLFRKVFSAPTG
jgi:hypothetical protein